uniref:Uncharacterized protein n=3 Tax=Ciona intestinalis TaxID=7719 RepID=F6XV42_CIOIN
MRFPADIFITFTFLHHVFAVIGNTKDVVCDTYVKQPSVWSCCPGEATNFKELTQNAKTTPWSKLQLKDAVYFRGIPVDENSTRTLRLCIIAPMGYRASVTVNVKAPFNTSSVGPAERETCTHPRVDIWAKNVYNSQASMDASPLNREARHTDERTRTANSKRRTRKNNTKRRPQFELRNSYSNKRTSAVLP